MVLTTNYFFTSKYLVETQTMHADLFEGRETKYVSLSIEHLVETS